MQTGLRPLVAGHDFPIQLNRDAVGFHAELLDQRAQGFGRQDSALPVDGELHPGSLSLLLAIGASAGRTAGAVSEPLTARDAEGSQKPQRKPFTTEDTEGHGGRLHSPDKGLDVAGPLRMRSGRVRGTRYRGQEYPPHKIYSAGRKRNFRVAVRPATFACTKTEEVESASSLTGKVISALPLASVRTWA